MAHASAAQSGAAAKPLRYDAAVQAIMVPTDDAQYAELNPAVHAPRVVIRNDGTDPLMGISIQYGTDGFLQRLYAWTGQLATGGTAEVTLPHLIDMKPGTNTFTVVLGHPNGRKDKNKANNTLSTTFTAAPVLESPLTVRWRVPAGVGGSLRLENTRGPLPLERTWKAGPDTVFQELVELPTGSYFLQVVDEHLPAGRQGRTAHAAVRVTNADGELIAAFHGKPKQGSMYQFRVDEHASAIAPLPFVGDVIPKQGRGQALVDAWSQQAAEIVVRDAEEEPVDGWALPAGNEVTKTVDLSGNRSGTYRVLLRQEGSETEIGRIELP